MGLLLTPLGVLYTDVQQTLPIATTFLMLFTPVVYPIPNSGLARGVAGFNPLTPLVTATRDWLTVGEQHMPLLYPSPHCCAGLPTDWMDRHACGDAPSGSRIGS